LNLFNIIKASIGLSSSRFKPSNSSAITSNSGRSIEKKLSCAPDDNSEGVSPRSR